MMQQTETDWNRLKQFETDWNRLNQTDPDWTRLNQTETEWNRQAGWLTECGSVVVPPACQDGPPVSLHRLLHRPTLGTEHEAAVGGSQHELHSRRLPAATHNHTLHSQTLLKQKDCGSCRWQRRIFFRFSVQWWKLQRWSLNFAEVKLATWVSSRRFSIEKSDYSHGFSSFFFSIQLNCPK